MPHDGKVVSRETGAGGHVIIALAGSAASKLQLDTAAASEHRSWRASQLVSRQYAAYWLFWLLLCGCFAIRHTTKLLDAAGQQHYLLAPPSSDGRSMDMAAAFKQQLQEQTHITSTSTRGSRASSLGEASSPGNHSSAVTDDILAAQRTKWPDGYVAVCAVIKDQWPDLRYWIEYHRWLGVSKFYIYDNNSTLPSMLVLWDYMQEGIVEYEYFLGRPRRKPDFTDTNQYRAYQSCLLQHFKQHRWLAFIDADEFFVIPHESGSSSSNSSHSSSQNDAGLLSNHQAPSSPPSIQDAQRKGHYELVNQHGTVITQDAVGTELVGPPSPDRSAILNNSMDVPAQNLAVFLSQYESQAALGVNWVLFGSSGHLVRPDAGPLASYTACIPQEHWESTHVKVIANTGGVLGMGHTPHEIVPRAGRTIVDVDQLPFKGPKTPKAKWHKLVLHHYVLKSKAEFMAKQARGSGAGNKKDWGYWQYVEQLANQTCPGALPVSEAFLSSKPSLSMPASAHFLQGCHRKAVAAYSALLLPEGTDMSKQHEHEGDWTALLPC